jgi:hypothetical protein
MTFGFFWDGIHLVELDPKTGMQRETAKDPVRLAWGAEIEAPFLHRRGDYYHLFVNWGNAVAGSRVLIRSESGGRSRLRMLPMKWNEDGWAVVRNDN